MFGFVCGCWLKFVFAEFERRGCVFVLLKERRRGPERKGREGVYTERRGGGPEKNRGGWLLRFGS